MEKQLQSLRQALDTIGEYCRKHRLEKELCRRIELICEELIVNMLNHTPAERFGFGLETEKGQTRIRLQYHAPAFDPTQLPEKQQAVPETMEYGGLGLFLVNSVARKINYTYDEKQALNVIEVIV